MPCNSSHSSPWHSIVVGVYPTFWYLWCVRRYRYGSLAYVLKLEDLSNAVSRTLINRIDAFALIVIVLFATVQCWLFRDTYSYVAQRPYPLPVALPGAPWHFPYP